jgi:hypothetical protein
MKPFIDYIQRDEEETCSDGLDWPHAGFFMRSWRRFGFETSYDFYMLHGGRVLLFPDTQGLLLNGFRTSPSDPDGEIVVDHELSKSSRGPASVLADGASQNTSDDAPLDELVSKSRSDDVHVRQDAVLSLGDFKCSEAVEALIAALNDDDYSICAEAARCLGKIGDCQAVIPLVKALNDEDPGVRAACSESLGIIGDRGAVEPLIAALDDSDRSVRVLVIKALGLLADERAADHVARFLDDKSSNLSQAAREALDRITGATK